jgi:hypothetical protein
MKRFRFALATLLSVGGAVLAAALPAFAQGVSCWFGESISVGATAPSGTCAPPCAAGLTCCAFNVTATIYCNAPGDTGCTYCVWLGVSHRTPGGLVSDTSWNIQSGFTACGTQPVIRGSGTYSYAPGTYVGALAAVYDVPCSSVTATTPRMDYDDLWMTVPDAP